MTEEAKNKLFNNEMFKASCSLAKEYQEEIFTKNNIPLDGEVSRCEQIGLFAGIVIYRFKNGLLHAVGEPAIQYANHYEYWEDGKIIEVHDVNLNVSEYWADGFPLKIEEYIKEE